MLLRVFAALVLVASVSALTCYTCDSFLSCNSPVTEYCPPTTQCYTVRHQGRVQYKGCAVSCRHLPYGSGPDIQCHACDSNNCNVDSSPASGFGSAASLEEAIEDILDSDESEELKSNKNRRHVGGGVQAHNGIGSGAVANPYGNQHNSIGSGVQGHNGGGHAIGSGAQGNHHGGIGSGASYNIQGNGRDSLGRGVQPNHGIGSGVSSNGHHHGKNRNRRHGIGSGVNYDQQNQYQNHQNRDYQMGTGVRPTKSAINTMTALPVIAAVAKLFL